MAVSPSKRNIENGLENQAKRIKIIHRPSSEEKIDESVEFDPELLNLKEQVKKLEEIKANLRERIANLENENSKKDKQIAELQSKLAETQNKLVETQNKLAETQNKLGKMESALRNGQIAYDFEKDLATYIYPPDKKFGSRKIFTNMKEWLKEEKDTPKGRLANDKWNELQKEFSWSSEHEQVFFKLLKSRIPFAHPNVGGETLQSQIPHEFTETEKKCFTDINKMINRINILMG